MKQKLAFVGILGICAALFLWQENVARQPRVTPTGQPALVEVDQAEMTTLRQEFNAAAGEVRVMVWLSPT